MSDPEDTFDPTLKKKKVKKVPASVLTDNAETNINSNIEPIDQNQQVDKITDDVDDLNLGNAKKKKKKKPLDFNDVENTNAEEKGPEGDAEEGDKGDENMDDNLDFSGLKKKKKTKKDKILTDLVDEKGETDGNVVSQVQDDSDHTYDALLKRVFDIMREKNPDMVAGERKMFKMKPPQVVRVGTKKTSFANFAEICKMLHRQQKHLLNFLLAELGTSGSLDANFQLIIKGRFQQKQIENVLRRYIKEYVTCHTCKSPDTILQKDTRLYFLQCETCGSRCSVTSIKSGFQAVTGKRAAIRAKAT